MMTISMSNVPDLGDLLEWVHEALFRDLHLVDTCASDGEVRVGLRDMIPHVGRVDSICL